MDGVLISKAQLADAIFRRTLDRICLAPIG
jgi:hypothetical protein